VGILVVLKLRGREDWLQRAGDVIEERIDPAVEVGPAAGSPAAS
jgi:hypothetical protein